MTKTCIRHTATLFPVFLLGLVLGATLEAHTSKFRDSAGTEIPYTTIEHLSRFLPLDSASGEFAYRHFKP